MKLAIAPALLGLLLGPTIGACARKAPDPTRARLCDLASETASVALGRIEDGSAQARKLATWALSITPAQLPTDQLEAAVQASGLPPETAASTAGRTAVERHEIQRRLRDLPSFPGDGPAVEAAERCSRGAEGLSQALRIAELFVDGQDASRLKTLRSDAAETRSACTTLGHPYDQPEQAAKAADDLDAFAKKARTEWNAVEKACRGQ